MLAVAAVVAGIVAPPKPPQGTVSFDDRQSNLVLTAPGYVLTLRKTNGAIVGIEERPSGATLTRGSKDGCLWGTTAPGATPEYVGACSWYPGGADRFAYAWDAATRTLKLTYAGNGPAGSRLGATVTLTAGDSSFDLKLDLENHTGAVIQNVPFPSDLVFDTPKIQAGYTTTFLPGVRLLPGFFTRDPSVWTDEVFTYPSRWAFADWIGLDIDGGHLSYYVVNPAPSPVQTVSIGFLRPTAPHPCGGDFICSLHIFDTWIPNGASWSSPVVRFRVGSTAQESMLDYRTDNGIDRYPSVADKLGARLDTLARSPLLKADVWQGVGRFDSWGPLLHSLPSPSLLHPLAFQAGGFDANDPDFLPPDVRWGTTADLRSAMSLGHSLGIGTMPYLNITWWDEDSPTASALKPNDFAVLDDRGQPVTDRYDPHTGYRVSPYAKAVRDRFASMIDEWTKDMPADCLFFDQIGARPARPDFNPAAPDPMSYETGWLGVAAPYADRCLMVEDGWDRLAESFVGFHGSLMLKVKKPDELNIDWGDGNWQAWPLATWLLHDKVLMYQHDAYPQTMTTGLDVLSFNLAFGLILSYSLDDRIGAMASPWLELVGDFQHALGPLYAGRPLTGWRQPSPSSTESTFGDGSLTVVKNWSKTDGLTVDAFGLPPEGVVARSGDGSVVAGSFVGSFFGKPLADGIHYLVLERDAATASIRQPIGGETTVAVPPPTGWQPGQPLTATAYVGHGVVLGTVPLEVQDGLVVLRYGPIDGQQPDEIRISSAGP
jgi:hypothetical protein